MDKVTAKKESAYHEAAQTLRYALEDANLSVEQKNAMANVFETMDEESSSATDFANAAIVIIGRTRDDAPELLPRALTALARASDLYSIYW